MLKVNQHRHGIDSSRECECGHGTDDAQHFFLECERHSHIRKAMINDITTIWQGSDNEGSLSLTVSFLLAPFSNGKLTFQEAQEIVLAVFRYAVYNILWSDFWRTTLVHQRRLISRTVTQRLQSVLTYKWRPITNYSPRDYLLCVDLQCGHLQCWNHVRTDVPRRNNNYISSDLSECTFVTYRDISAARLSSNMLVSIVELWHICPTFAKIVV